MATRPPDPAESLPALAAQVADLRGRLLGLQAKVDNASMQGGLKLAAEVAAIRDQLGALTRDDPAPLLCVPAWHTLTPDERRSELDLLTQWVTGFLTVNYPHVPLRPCWPDHPALLWELSALHTEWRRVYERTRPELAGALAWHDRWLPGATLRITRILKDCKAGCALVKAPLRLQPQPQPQPRAG